MKKIFTALAIMAASFMLGAGGAYLAMGAASCSAGSCNGAISVDGSNNAALGTTTVNGTSKLFIAGSSTNSSYYALYATDQAGNPLLIVRNDGKVDVATSTFVAGSAFRVYGEIESASGTVAGGLVFPDGTTQTTAAGSSVNAANVATGTFGANTGIGSYSFPASLSVGTTTVPTNLNVFGGGAALTGVTSQLDVFSSTTAAQNVGGLITFAGYFGGTVSSTRFAAVQGFKENATFNNNAGALGFLTHANGVNLSQGAVISSGGNVGIATTSPNTLLHVQGAVNQLIKLQRTSAAPAEIQYTNSAKTFYAGIGGGGGFSIGTSSVVDTNPNFTASTTAVIILSNRLTGVATPTGSNDVATKAYVDAAFATSSVTWAGYTTTTYTGAVGGDKAAVNDCQNSFPGSVPMNIDDLIRLGSQYPWSQDAWVYLGGSTGGTSLLTCNDWTSNSSGVQGVIISAVAGTINPNQTCNLSEKFGCVYKHSVYAY